MKGVEINMAPYPIKIGSVWTNALNLSDCRFVNGLGCNCAGLQQLILTGNN